MLGPIVYLSLHSKRMKGSLKGLLYAKIVCDRILFRFLNEINREFDVCERTRDCDRNNRETSLGLMKK